MRILDKYKPINMHKWMEEEERESQGKYYGSYLPKKNKKFKLL